MASIKKYDSKFKRTMLVYTPTGTMSTFDYATPIAKWTEFFTLENKSDPFYRIIFIVHGFTDNLESHWISHLKNTLIIELKSKPVVVMVGWVKGSSWSNLSSYKKAVEEMPKVGAWVGQYVRAIRTELVNCHIHGIGHGLGAHLLGIAARAGSRGFHRITGLDPAGPLFERQNQMMMLRKNDAQMVDVIHTDGCSTETKHPSAVFKGESKIDHYGTLLPLGTVDFYPNFGTSPQSGLDLGHKDLASSHIRAIELFTWSIAHPGHFITFQTLATSPDCDVPVKQLCPADRAEMGYHADARATGQYFIETNTEAPWSLLETRL